MRQNSIIIDMLVLIGALPISKPTKVEQQKKRMGYPTCYLRHFSEKEQEKMRQETKQLFDLFR